MKSVKVCLITAMGVISAVHAQQFVTKKDVTTQDAPKQELMKPTLTLWGRVGGGVQYLSGVHNEVIKTQQFPIRPNIEWLNRN